MAIITVIKDLSLKQRADLIYIVNKSEVFTVDERGYVCVVDVKNGHPEIGKMGPVPIGLIEWQAYLLNTELSFPEDYHGMLKSLYQSL